MELLDDLDDAQLAAVTCPSDPVCVLARAGAGKTRVLTRRIAWRASQGTLDIRRVLAITFTTRAAGELTGRLNNLLGRDSGTTGTFHGIAWRMIRDFHEERRTAPPNVAENPRLLLEAAVPRRFKGSVTAIANEISWAAARDITPAGYERAVAAGVRTPPIPAAAIAEVHAAYAKSKKHRRVVDFDDLIGICADLLANDATFAAAQRWRYRHFFVDEYQDTNPLQQRLLDAWLSGRDDLFVVGDPNQAIYGFNGADAGFLTDFAQRYPDATVVELTTNHRSTPPVVHLANAVLARPIRSRPDHGIDAPTITACADDQAEAITIARRIRSEHTPGHQWRSQAILVRTHAQRAPIVDTLERAGIPVATRDDPGPLDAVRVLSFHAAKGLEWPVVHIAGVEEGFVPDIHAKDAHALEEERRLLYVATSRATRQVHLTWAKQRTFGDKVLTRSPSRWLEAMAQTIEPHTTPRVRRAGPQSTIQPRTTQAPDTQAPDTPRARLVAWRASTARAASMPAAVVLSDRTLEALVRDAPRHMEDLMKVPGLGSIKARRYGTALLNALHPGNPR